MPIKNYYTEVPAMKSIGQIQGNLVAHGATKVMVEYGSDREPASLSFIVPTAQGELPFRLPANVQKVEKILLDMRARPLETWHHDYANVMAKIRRQAARVAWRIIKDWVDAQLAIIETEMVTMEQVFLPYLLTQDGQKTLYDTMADRNFLPPGKGQ